MVFKLTAWVGKFATYDPYQSLTSWIDILSVEIPGSTFVI